MTTTTQGWSRQGRLEDLEPSPVDVVVVGAGVVGCAVAREAARARLRVAVVDARGDVGDGTSKANTAILHTGFDATPGTLESRLVRRGYDLLGAYAASTGIPVERTGALLVAWDDEQQDALPKLGDKAVSNGYLGCEVVDDAEVYRRVPALGPGARGGLVVPGESIICTWTTTVALATDALARGARIHLRAHVEALTFEDEETLVRTSRGTLRTRWLVNAAGLGSSAVDRLAGHDRFTVTPRRGQLIVFDKLSRPLAPTIVLPVPTSRGKGVLVSPTVYGNVMLGPTAEDLDDPTATETTADGLSGLLDHGRRIMPRLLAEEVTATYAGLRAATEHADYVVDLDAEQRYVVAAGIRSTGLTASMAIAEHLAELMSAAGVDLRSRPDLPAPPQVPNLGEATPRPYARPDLIATDPEYGRVVCFCERVTAGEIRDAMRSALPPADLDGLRRRTRAMNGRCQGFYCGAEVAAALDGRPDPAQVSR